MIAKESAAIADAEEAIPLLCGNVFILFIVNS